METLGPLGAMGGGGTCCADAMDNGVEVPQRLDRTSRGSCNATSGRTLRNRKQRPEELFVQLGSQQMREEAAQVPDDGEWINQVC